MHATVPQLQIFDQADTGTEDAVSLPWVSWKKRPCHTWGKYFAARVASAGAGVRMEGRGGVGGGGGGG